ncbi:uncharacterized protein UV8b_08061 [Ustilaginoidea virens]|uniref:Glutamine-dependent NAD(+) synthetase n=1 Tax=Ustilaginoidea virens TaxID=1159556 RepID=A0A8E5HYP4_USTVR|nr:uncharacterized protein UV8b_08061 [Ustilaginoidea virens]QUC23820.1 hypothetical protein UV8b_08061 [Ustilaginoidea virens]
MGRCITVATCSLRQWALDFEGNTARIIESIRQAKAAGARLRVGPELEITGYGCNDHFLESDVFLHSFEMLARIMSDESCHGILIDTSCPIQHRNTIWNCRVLLCNGKILYIRPKMDLANTGNYRETRWFTPWMKRAGWEEYHLPRMLQKLQGATHVPFGDVVLSTPDSTYGSEYCEELWAPESGSVLQSLDGIEIFSNGSSSHYELQKLGDRVQLIAAQSKKVGGLYLYSNQQGCDGERVYYDGCSMIFLNGELLAATPQFTLEDVSVATATIDLEDIRAHRQISSRNFQAARKTLTYHRIHTPFELSPDLDDDHLSRRPTLPREPKYHHVAEELALAAGCWLWDYLARSGSCGYLIPLSGGLDSCSTAVLVHAMARIAIDAMNAGNKTVTDTLKRLFGDQALPKTAQELCHRVLHTVYMGARVSSSETRRRARDIAASLGSYHLEMSIDPVYDAMKTAVTENLDIHPNFKTEGGSDEEGKSLQNIQARVRMVAAYTYAQLLPLKRQLRGHLLVLGSSNVGESLRGYFTKWDNSAADISPIGSVDKQDLVRLLEWAKEEFSLPVLDETLKATPTAELEPVTEEYCQSDEADMGMSYAELTLFGRLRKERKMGPYSMFMHLVRLWGKDGDEVDDAPSLEPAAIADKVKAFHHFVAINAHKRETLTASLHCNSYSCDSNRFDLRPFLYPPFWKSWSFKRIDREVARLAQGKQRPERPS